MYPSSRKQNLLLVCLAILLGAVVMFFATVRDLRFDLIQKLKRRN
jgi:ABC-type enterochelin transport system permease subunit